MHRQYTCLFLQKKIYRQIEKTWTMNTIYRPQDDESICSYCAYQIEYECVAFSLPTCLAKLPCILFGSLLVWPPTSSESKNKAQSEATYSTVRSSTTLSSKILPCKGCQQYISGHMCISTRIYPSTRPTTATGIN